MNAKIINTLLILAIVAVLGLAGYFGYRLVSNTNTNAGSNSTNNANTTGTNSLTNDTTTIPSVTVDPAVFKDVLLRAVEVNAANVGSEIYGAEGTVPAGQTVEKKFFVPSLSQISVIMSGKGLLVRFQPPQGEAIIPGTTANNDVYTYFSDEGIGLSGFSYTKPPVGEWSVRFSAPKDQSVEYGLAVETDDATAAVAHVESMLKDSDPRFSFLAKPGDTVFIRTFLTQGGKILPGTTWTIIAETPSKTKVMIPVHDDGQHADGQANDGVAVGAVTAEGPDGFYQLEATGKTADGPTYITGGLIEVQAKNDLLIEGALIIEPAAPSAGQPVVVAAMAKSVGSVDASNIKIELLVNKTSVANTTFSLKAGGSQRVSLQWTPTAPGAYEVQLTIDPFSGQEPYASNFENNTQKATVTVR